MFTSRRAIRGLSGDSRLRLRVLGLVPTSSSATRHPLPSPGSAQLTFPCFNGTMGTLRLLQPVTPAHCVRQALPTLRLVLRSVPGQTLPRMAWGLGIGDPQPKKEGVGDCRPPRFLGDPDDGSLGSRTPVGSTRQAITACRRGPRLCQQRGLPTRGKCFEAQCPSFPSGCLRFVKAVTRLHARLASGCRPALPGGIG